MLKWLKADFRKYWATWIGFGGLVVIGIPLFAYIATPIGERLLMMLLGWMFFSMGLFWEAQTTKLVGYTTSEEMNKPYV